MVLAGERLARGRVSGADGVDMRLRSGWRNLVLSLYQNGQGYPLLRGRKSFVCMSLFVGDHLADFGDVLSDGSDLLGPGASGVIRVGDSGDVFALGFGEAFVEVSEFLFERWAGHG